VGGYACETGAAARPRFLFPRCSFHVMRAPTRWSRTKEKYNDSLAHAMYGFVGVSNRTVSSRQLLAITEIALFIIVAAYMAFHTQPTSPEPSLLTSHPPQRSAASLALKQLASSLSVAPYSAGATSAAGSSAPPLIAHVPRIIIYASHTPERYSPYLPTKTGSR
jgi:hypothetical protein